jgi:hypothetical protein
MTSAEWIDMLRVLPEAEHGKLVIVLRNGTELCVDTIVRFEDEYLVMRGRQGGTVEEARGFFVPYDQMLCLRLDRITKVEELNGFYGDAADAAPAALSDSGRLTRPAPAGAPAPTDPAAASKLLLEKIRQARANSAGRFPS